MLLRNARFKMSLLMGIFSEKSRNCNAVKGLQRKEGQGDCPRRKCLPALSVPLKGRISTRCLVKAWNGESVRHCPLRCRDLPLIFFWLTQHELADGAGLSLPAAAGNRQNWNRGCSILPEEEKAWENIHHPVSSTKIDESRRPSRLLLCFRTNPALERPIPTCRFLKNQ